MLIEFHRFQPDSRNEASLTHGTTCVGKAWDITQRLKEISVESHVIVESAGPDEPPVHAMALSSSQVRSCRLTEGIL